MATASQSTPDIANNQHRTLVFSYPDLSDKISRYKIDVNDRERREEQNLLRFIDEWNIQPSITNSSGQNSVEQTISALQYWCEHSSTECSNCNSIQFCNLLPSFLRKNKPKPRQACACRGDRYVIPRVNLIPDCLQGLTTRHIAVLRPFDLDCGVYKREQHGYRVKTGMIKLQVSSLYVLDKIRAITEKDDRDRCMKAYNFLINSKDSSYNSFVLMRNTLVQCQAELNVFDMSKTVGIECVLWAKLVPIHQMV